MYPASLTSTNIVVTRDETELDLAIEAKTFYGSTTANVYICKAGDVISYATNTQYRFRTIFVDGTDETSALAAKTYTVPENAIFVGIIL